MKECFAALITFSFAWPLSTCFLTAASSDYRVSSAPRSSGSFHALPQHFISAGLSHDRLPESAWSYFTRIRFCLLAILPPVVMRIATIRGFSQPRSKGCFSDRILRFPRQGDPAKTSSEAAAWAIVPLRRRVGARSWPFTIRGANLAVDPTVQCTIYPSE